MLICYMLNQVFLKTYDTQFDEIIIKFKNRNGILWETKDEVNLTLLTNK